MRLRHFDRKLNTETVLEHAVNGEKHVAPNEDYLKQNFRKMDAFHFVRFYLIFYSVFFWRETKKYLGEWHKIYVIFYTFATIPFLLCNTIGHFTDFEPFANAPYANF